MTGDINVSGDIAATTSAINSVNAALCMLCDDIGDLSSPWHSPQ